MIYYCIKNFQQFKIGNKFDLDESSDLYIIRHLIEDEYISKVNPKKKRKNVKSR